MKVTANGKAVSERRFWPSQMPLIMRLTAILLLTATLHVSAIGLSQTVTIYKSNASLEQIFELLQQQTGYSFMFNSHMLDKAKKVTVRVSNGTVEEVLAKCFSNQPFSYVIHEKIIIVKEKEEKKAGLSPPKAPPGQVTGTVKDENNAPIEGAAVTVKNQGGGTVTNKQGKFQMNLPNGTYEIEISFVGYKTVLKTVTVSNDQPVNITVTLQVTATGLTDMVVVGYGSQRKRDVTGSVSSVKGEDIKNLPVSNAATALQGRATGVDIVSGDGSPGNIPSIRIRGTGTINNADPLVVIDGVPAGGLNDVNTNDIASIEILKDASASAIYGSRAANGVVLITTKKGNFGEQLKTTVNLFTGSNKAVKYLNMLSAPDLAALKSEAYTNDGLTAPALWSQTYYKTQRTDWQRALIGTGHVKNADLALRGGNNNSSYSISGNYYDDKGMIINSYFKRYSARINSEHKIGSRIRVGENVVYSNTNGSAPNTRSSQTGLVWSAIRFNPALPIKNDDGTWGSSQSDQQLGDINNPVATATEVQKSSKTDRILANAFAELEIVKGLKVRANYGYDHAANEYYEFDNEIPGQARSTTTSLAQSFYKTRTLLEEYFITYNHLFSGVHNITLTGGYSAQKTDGNYFGASRNGFADTTVAGRVLNLGASSSAANYGSSFLPSGLQSYFVRGNYSYKNKYLLTATFRADGSSRFAPGQRWGYFPAFSGGWRISDEKFYGDRIKNVINSLKITGGWGQLGNQNVGDFQFASTIGYGSGGGMGGGGYGYNLGTGTTNMNGAYITSLANPNITWERAVMTNISAELAALNNHLTATITYFNKNTTDMLIPLQLVETFGAQTNLPDNPGNITLPDYNLGSLNNHGVEIELNYQNTIGKVSYSFGVNGSFLRNKVTKLYGNSTYLASTPYGRENVDISRTYEGQPIASFYGFRADGLYQDQSEIDKDPNIANDPNKANIKPGDVKFRDISGNGIIDDSDRVRLGDPNPHFVFGFHGSVGYRHFDLTFNFAGATGFQLYNADRLSGLDATQVYNWYAGEKNRWHGEGTSNSIPRLSVSNLNNNYRSSNLWVQNGAYLSLKSLSLGYTLSGAQISDVKIPDTRIYFSAYNVFMVTKYTGYTPELGYSGNSSPFAGNPSSNGNPSSLGSPGQSSSPGLQKGVDLAQYPAARNFTIGATFNF